MIDYIPLYTFLICINVSYFIVSTIPNTLQFLLTSFAVNLFGKGKHFDMTKMLSLAFLSDHEKHCWMAVVDGYANVISENLLSTLLYLIKHSFLENVEKVNHGEESAVSHIHTGSIPSQFGKPLMLLSNLPSLVTDSFTELSSDHDLMFCLDDLPVCQTQRGGPHLFAQINPEPGKEEFVSIHMMDRSKGGVLKVLQNIEATEFLMKIVSNTFFTSDGEMTNAAKSLPVMRDQLDISAPFSSPFHKNESFKFLVSRSGPSVNLQVTVDRGVAVFDCDMLLALPLTGWPLVATEWKIRQRKWPEKEQVDHLSSLPCHLIPKPMKEGDDEHWRFSFSRQELYLASILPYKARITYVALKYIFKKHLKKMSHGLKSYHMLTVFLWFMEDTNPEMWKDEDANPFEEQNKDTEILVLDDSIPMEYVPSDHMKSTEEMIRLN